MGFVFWKILKYNIDFTLVLPNEEIKQLYTNA